MGSSKTLILDVTSDGNMPEITVVDLTRASGAIEKPPIA
jgi:hypothetical protein